MATFQTLLFITLAPTQSSLAYSFLGTFQSHSFVSNAIKQPPKKMLRYVITALAAVAAASPVANIQPRQTPGQVYFGCSVPNTVALTFDDGPFMYTDGVLDALAGAGMKATFFLNGQNWASIFEYSATVQRMVNEGHQVGSHT